MKSDRSKYKMFNTNPIIILNKATRLGRFASIKNTSKEQLLPRGFERKHHNLDEKS